MHRDGKRRKEAGGSERYEEDSIGVNKEVSKTTKSKREMREEKRRTAAIAVYRLEVPVFVGDVWGLKHFSVYKELPTVQTTTWSESGREKTVRNRKKWETNEQRVRGEKKGMMMRVRRGKETEELTLFVIDSNSVFVCHICCYCDCWYGRIAGCNMHLNSSRGGLAQHPLFFYLTKRPSGCIHFTLCCQYWPGKYEKEMQRYSSESGASTVHKTLNHCKVCMIYP